MDRMARRRLLVACGAVALVAVIIIARAVGLHEPAPPFPAETPQYQISERARALLTALPDSVRVTVYKAAEPPAGMARFGRELERVLDACRAAGGGRLRTSFADPASDAAAARRADSLGIRPIRVRVLKGDHPDTVSVMLGFSVRSRGREEAVPLVADPGRLEYDLCAAILKVTAEEPRAVGFLTGHGERSIQTDYRAVALALSGAYNLREVNLAADPTALEGVTTLIVPGARHVADAELFLIDQFIMRGGRAMFLLDGADVDYATLMGRPTVGNIFDFVASYGATVNPDLVVDAISSAARFRSGDVTREVPYVYWPKATARTISRESPIVSGLGVIAFPWTSSVTVREHMPGAAVTVLVRSSDRSTSVTALAHLDPSRIALPTVGAESGTGGRPLAVAMTGTFASAFLGRPVIVERDGKAELTWPRETLDASRPTQIIVVGNSRMFEDRLLSDLEGSLDFCRRAVDWLTFGDVLTAIPVRSVRTR